MGMKKWSVNDYDKALAKELAYECDIDPIVALIASSRGYTDPMELEEFLYAEIGFTDPKDTADIIKAADIINAVIENGEKIAVYGDYDCDGVTATALLIHYLRSRNADAIYYIPNRFDEGYGMNCESVKRLAESGVKLIITVDNGIKCHKEIDLANSLGIDVIVTDHHLPDDILPHAAAVVDPHRMDDVSEFKQICGAEVVFRLICVMENKEPEELLSCYADILSLAVIGDIMPVTAENRSIIKFGIEKLKNNAFIGLSALINIAGLEKQNINASKIAFGLVPRINAAGRMGKAERAVELLLSDNMMKALAIADEIDKENSLRQATEKKIFEEAIAIIESSNLKYDRVIVVSGENWHHGVVGIVASKISERYGAPSILLSDSEGVAIGSGRSIDGFSLYDSIEFCEDLLDKFGGHSGAAGLTLKSEKINEFRIKINEYAKQNGYIAPEIKLDCKLNPSALTIDLAFAIEMLEPFGEGNKPPLFGLYGVKLERITPIANGKHLRLLFSKNETTFQCLLFGVTADSFCFEVSDILDLAVNVEANFYREEYNVSVHIKALRLSGVDDDKLFKEIEIFNDFFAEKENDFALICPSREEVGEIYRFILEAPVLPDRVKYIFTNKIGFGKTGIALKTLLELGLVEIRKDRKLSSVLGASKTALTNSDTYKRILERSGNNE